MKRVNSPYFPVIRYTRACTRLGHQCFRYGINEQILFEVGMCSEIERVIEGMIVTIQMWITPISSSNGSAAVIAEAIEVDSKPFKSILPFEVKVF